MASDDESADDLNLSALEDAVAELGLEVDSDDEGPDDGPSPLDVNVEAEPARNLGLDLTELPPPTAAAGQGGRSMPPLGEATADDLFGPLDDGDFGDSSSMWGAGATSEPPSADAPGDEPAAARAEPELAPVSGLDREGAELEAAALPPRAEADQEIAGVVGFTAHGGTITGTIRAKPGKKLFGR